MRDPLTFTQWDECAGESACAAQLLYVYGCLGDEDVPYIGEIIDSRTGRPEYQPDLDCRNMEMLLEEGFRVHRIAHCDPRLVVGDNGQEYLRALWATEGMDTSPLPDVYPVIQHRTQRQSELRHRYPRQFTQELGRRADERGFRDALNRNRCVGYTQSIGNGFVRDLLALPLTECREYCQIYDPGAGTVTKRPIGVVIEEIGPSFTSFWLPS